MRSRQALQNYLLSVRCVTGADTVSVFVCSGADQRPDFVLHEGVLPPVPELESEVLGAQLVVRAPNAESGQQPGAAHPLLHFQPSSADGGYLLGFDIARIQAVLAETRPAASDQCRKPRAISTIGTAQEILWLGLRYSSGSRASFIADYFKRAQAFTCEIPESGEDWLMWTLTLGGLLAWESYRLSALHQDHISQLAGRTEFQVCLENQHERAVRDRYPLALLLVNPDEFGLTNHRLGRETGDAALREVAMQLASNLRSSDSVYRYGGAVFCVLMPGTTPDAARAAADKLRQTLSKHGYLDGAARFAFSTGVAVYEPSDDVDSDVLGEPGELLRRADQALNVAKLSGGARTVVWSPDEGASQVDTLDRLSGIFTADTEKDYRNMLLLWDAITVISLRPETEAIAAEFVDRVGSTFAPERVCLYTDLEDDQPRLLAANCAKPDGEGRISDKRELPLSSEQNNLMAMAQKHQRTERLRLAVSRQGGASTSHSKAQFAYAVPLLVRDECLGCLYLRGPEDTLALDNSDLVFLDALASQIGVALDRAKLAARWEKEQERERRQLREEVRGLRNALQHSRVVYRSSQMQSVLDVLRRVAPTDTTVLITGESGTGKEVLARTLHDQSLRHKQPFVTVDCGTIAQSLMEAELFGHLKGAFTGAQEASQGRIAQAEGGTLFLDEIGELPLEVQAKLLRFVQEKEFTPVGSSSSRQVDVRIVAATNRDLAAESAAGTFRTDLYYRLQVVTLTSPPLRERPDDILPLAHYFLEKFAVQNDKGALRLSPQAEAALLCNSWTGNVRELQNRILQAVVMSEAEEIDWRELGLDDADATIPPQPLLKAAEQADQPAPITLDDTAKPWEALRSGLGHQVRQALSKSNGSVVPLGRWLASDLVLAADSAVNGIARQASTLLGMAETTFRRQIDKARQESAAGLSVRTPEWSALNPLITGFIASAQESSGQNLMDLASQLLLEEVLEQVADNDTLGSALLGVTKLTYQRRKAALHT